MGHALVRFRPFVAAFALQVALAACNATSNAASGPGGVAASTADGITKAVYANDAEAVTSNFDAQLKTQVSRAEVGALSDTMHGLGSYKGLTFVSSDPAKNEYTYRADFDKGAMNVVVRMDADGKVAAYRLFPLGGT